MRTYIILVLACVSLGCNTKAPKSFDCKEFLARKVNVTDDVQASLKEFENYRYCGLDSIDMKYFVNGPIIGPLLISITSEKGDATYDDVLKRILPIIKEPEYIKIKNAHIKLLARKDEVVTDENWPELSKMIIDANGYTSEQMHDMEGLYKEHIQDKWTVGMLIKTFIAQEENWLKEQPPKIEK